MNKTIKNPCFFTTVTLENNKQLITAICMDCQKEKNLTGWYWDSDFNEEDDEIKCHFCSNIIFLRENNEDK